MMKSLLEAVSVPYEQDGIFEQTLVGIARNCDTGLLSISNWVILDRYLNLSGKSAQA